VLEQPVARLDAEARAVEGGALREWLYRADRVDASDEAPEPLERLRVVERFAVVDANTLTYRATVEDSTVFVRPWTVELSMDRTAGPLYEVACHEGNYGMANILSGHRAEEREPRR